jgi:predicted nucleic acid-binding protein
VLDTNAVVALLDGTREAILVTADADFAKVPDLEVLNPRRP